ncbi:MAG: acyl carrier protein [Bryobacteraceae bacterium]|nr:acyl carrier protein [Bryobacteraceae bacterium]
MDRQATIVKLIEQISKKRLSVEPGDSLFDSGLLDSFALPDLVAAIEKEFSIRIPDSDLNPRKFDSIERIEAYLDSRG